MSKGASKQLKIFLCGAVAGVFSRTITAPLDRVKLLLQVSASDNKASNEKQKQPTFFGTIKEIAQTEGFFGFFKGNMANCVRVAPHNAIRFFTFEVLKKSLMPVNAKYLPTSRKLLAGAIAGSCAVITMHPLDVVRARLAMKTTGAKPKYTGVVDCLSKIYKEEGFSGLYSGLSVAVLGYAPMSALTFASYELVKQASEFIFRRPPIVLTSCYGAISGAIAMTATYPFDIVKSNMMTQGARRLQQQNQNQNKQNKNKGNQIKTYNNGIECAMDIVSRNGVSGLYRGLGAAYAKVIPTISLTFFSYELMKKLLDVNK